MEKEDTSRSRGFGFIEFDTLDEAKAAIEGLNEMEHSGMSSALMQGMVASFNKISNIKKEQI